LKAGRKRATRGGAKRFHSGCDLGGRQLMRRACGMCQVLPRKFLQLFHRQY
jgi:hypothetical protein